VKGNYSLLF